MASRESVADHRPLRSFRARSGAERQRAEIVWSALIRHIDMYLLYVVRVGFHILTYSHGVLVSHRDLRRPPPHVLWFRFRGKKRCFIAWSERKNHVCVCGEAIPHRTPGHLTDPGSNQYHHGVRSASTVRFPPSLPSLPPCCARFVSGKRRFGREQSSEPSDRSRGGDDDGLSAQ